jgi:4-hydroxybenzoate polyprenyltransferase
MDTTQYISVIMKRQLFYQKPLGPLLAYAVMITVFGASTVAFSCLQRGVAVPGWQAYGTAVGVLLLIGLQLRAADVCVTAGDNARQRPGQPLSRGWVTSMKVRRVWGVAAILQLALVMSYDFELLQLLAFVGSYLGLMSVGFFCRNGLKIRPVIELLSTVLIVPLMAYFAAACEWLPREAKAPSGLGWFLAVSFLNGIVIQIGSKLRQPADEKEDVETYSKLWGKAGGAVVLLAAMLASVGYACMAATGIGWVWPVAMGLGCVWVLAVAVMSGYAFGRLHGKWIEMLTLVWVITLNLLLGLMPLIMRGAS